MLKRGRELALWTQEQGTIFCQCFRRGYSLKNWLILMASWQEKLTNEKKTAFCYPQNITVNKALVFQRYLMNWKIHKFEKNLCFSQSFHFENSENEFFFFLQHWTYYCFRRFSSSLMYLFYFVFFSFYEVSFSKSLCNTNCTYLVQYLM